jgi:DNA polymerase, archaea type
MESYELRLLTASYRKMPDRDEVMVELYGKTRDGRSIVVRNFGFKPYFHIIEPRPDLLARLRQNQDVLDIKELDLYYKGKLRPAAQVTVKYPWTVPSFRQDIKRQNFEVLAADIPFHHRFIYDKDMSSCIRAFGTPAKGDYTTDLVIDMDHFEEIEPFAPDLRILSFDLENSIADGNILTICYVVRDKGEIRDGEMIEGTEKHIIQRFSEIIQKEDPDVITGYNIDGYDIPKILERASKVGVKSLNWGRDRSDPRPIQKFWRLTGRLIVDAWWAVRTELRPKQETLNAVSKLLLNEEKMDVSAKNMDAEWLRDKDKVLRYCRQDASLALKVLEKVERIRKNLDLAAVSRLPVDDVLNSGNSMLVDSILIRAADRAIPRVGVPLTGDFDNDDEAIEGGYVHEIEPGLYHWVCILDFKSMYPSLIISKNICFTTRDDSGTNVSPVGVHFLTKEQKPGILPTMMSNLMRTRDETKAKMKSAKSPEEARYYDGLQAAVKVLMNSFYGVFASSFYRFTDRAIGSSITAYARERTKGIIQELEGEGGHVIYSDTDSVFVQSPHADLNGSIEFGTRLAERFSKEGGSLEFEKIMEPLFSHGKKKRYVGRMVWPKEELVIRGYEIRRTDSFELQSEALMAVFDKIMDEKMDEAVKIAKQYVQDTLCCKVPIEKLVISKGCRPFNQYAKPDSQLTVQVAKKLMASGEQFVPGMKVSWIVTNSKKSPQEAEPYVSGRPFTGQPDCRYYAERIAQSLGRATEVFGWDDKSLMAGNQQMNLLNAAFCDTEERKPTPIETAKKAEVRKTDKKLTLDDFF